MHLKRKTKKEIDEMDWNKQNEENKQLAEIVTEYLGPMDAKKIEDLKTVLDMYMSEFTEEKESEEESIEEKEQEGEDK